MTEIIELSKALEPAYSEFIQADESSMLYGTLQFREFLRRTVAGVPRYFVAVSGSRVIGALPCFSVSNPQFGEVINSLPWYGSYGGCQVQPGAGAAIRRALLSHYRTLLDSPETAFATLVLSPQENRCVDEYTAVIASDATDIRIGQITELPEDGPDIEMRLEKVLCQKTRNLARKARKQGFELSIADDDASWRFLHETHVENMAAVNGQAKPWAHFVAIRETIPANWRQLMVAILDGIPVAAMLLIRFNRTVEYITPVIKHEFRPLQPLSFLIWHGMLDAVRNGFRHWNWGGTWTTQKSLHHFKAGWGGQDHPYTYLIHAKPGALEALRRDRQAVAAAFPYYFLYPFHQLG